MVQGVSALHGNDMCNGAYNKTGSRACDNRDTFVHESADVYLYHIDTNVRGYWIFRYYYNCSDINGENGLVRADDLEFDPSLVQIGWEEKRIDDTWNRDGDIALDCVGKRHYHSITLSLIY